VSSTNGIIDRDQFNEKQTDEISGLIKHDPKKLIKQYCSKKDTGAFTIFYRQQADKLWRFLIARGCDQDTAYDILSEAFIRFTQNICKDPRSPVAFLYRIAINLHIDHYRRSNISPTVTDSEHIEKSTDDTPLPTDEHEYLRSLVKTLTPDEQNMLLMRFWIGMTHKEVAQALDVPEGTIRRQSAAILKLLANKWDIEQ